MPQTTVKVDRTTKWGNPLCGKPAPFGPTKARSFRTNFPRHAFVLYRSLAPLNPKLVVEARAELAGKNLACWCGKDDPYEDACHAAVLFGVGQQGDISSASVTDRQIEAGTPPGSARFSERPGSDRQT